ncbi:hypothetical protein DQM06_04400 [Lactiplantibacillus plantarum]|nr:hypothetical protein DQM06_04400 [Lactiplantibacillus plantarum]
MIDLLDQDTFAHAKKSNPAFFACLTASDGVSLSGYSRSFVRSSWLSLDWVRGVSARGLRNWSILTSFFLSRYY